MLSLYEQRRTPHPGPEKAQSAPGFLELLRCLARGDAHRHHGVAADRSRYFWPIWPIGGMEIAAFFIGLDAFGPNRGIITEDAIDEEVAKITRSNPRSGTNY
jgi:hypothetical protein